MGTTSINQGRVIVATATQHFSGLTQFSVSQPSQVGFCGGGSGGGGGLFALPSHSGTQVPSILCLLLGLSPWDHLHSTTE